RGIQGHDTGALEAHDARKFTKFTVQRAHARASWRGPRPDVTLAKARKRTIGSAYAQAGRCRTVRFRASRPPPLNRGLVACRCSVDQAAVDRLPVLLEQILEDELAPGAAACLYQRASFVELSPRDGCVPALLGQGRHGSDRVVVVTRQKDNPVTALDDRIG